MKRLLVIAFLLWASSASATTYYIATTGSDSNDGLTKSTPWLHAPGMFGCTANCYSHSPSAGNSYILRGGDTWYSNGAGTPTGVPWQWLSSWNGTSGSRIYIGVDQTWYAGGSWTRPVLSGGNPLNTNFVASCTYHTARTCYKGANHGGACSSDNDCGAGNCAGPFIRVHWAQYVTFDNLEFTGMCTDTSKDEIYFQTGQSGSPAQYNIYKNMYMHGWTHTQAGAMASKGGTGFLGGSATTGWNEYDSNTIDGTDSYKRTFSAQMWDCFNTHHTVYRYVAQGTVCNNPHLFHDNLIEYVDNHIDGTTHSNGWEFNGTTTLYGPNLVYNNITRHNTAAVTSWIAPNSTVPIYVYNNLWYDNASQTLDICQGGLACNIPSQAGSIYVINNTIESNHIPAANLNTSGGANYFWNNHCINPSGTCASGTATSYIFNDHNLHQSAAQATAAGYTSSNLYVPTASNSPTVDAGANRSTYFTVDRLGGSRPYGSAWDIGAYEYGSSGPYTVTPQVSFHGTPYGDITPSTAQTVTVGNTATFTVTPDANSHIYSVGGTCGGTLSGQTYTTSAVNSNCTVVATFGQTVTGVSDGCSSITCPSMVPNGEPATCTVQPGGGKHTSNITGGGGSYVFGDSYTTANLTSDTTVTATCAANTWSVTSSEGSHAHVDPLQVTPVADNGYANFTITVDSGYYVSISTQGGCTGFGNSGTTYTFGPITSNCSFIASALPLSVGGGGKGGVKSKNGKVRSTNGALKAR